MHIKRRTIPEFWPVPRTGTKYVAVPSHNQYGSVPLIVIMRDMLKLVKSKKELKKILNEKKALVNGKIVKETNYPVSLFDSIGIPSANRYYRADMKDKRMALTEINEKESNARIYKIIGKKALADKKMQLNLNDGRNLLSSEKANVGDFVMLNNTENRIIKIIPLEKNAGVIAIRGKHAGVRGKIEEISKEGENLVARISTKEGEIKANIKNLFVIEH